MFNQLGRSRHITGRQGVVERFVDQAVLVKPGAGPAVQGGNFVSIQPLGQLITQQFLEQMVVAVPPPLVVQGNGEQVFLAQPFQVGLSVTLRLVQAGHNVTQRATQPIKYGGLQEKVLDSRRLARQDFSHQVICHISHLPAQASGSQI